MTEGASCPRCGGVRVIVQSEVPCGTETLLMLRCENEACQWTWPDRIDEFGDRVDELDDTEQYIIDTLSENLHQRRTR